MVFCLVASCGGVRASGVVVCVGLCLLLISVCGVWLRCFEFCVGAWLLVRVGGGFRCRF